VVQFPVNKELNKIKYMNKNIGITIVAVVILGLIIWAVNSLKMSSTGSSQFSTNTPTPVAGAPTGSIRDLPASDITLSVRQSIAKDEKVGITEVVVVSLNKKNWPDSCLGISQPDTMCAQVITPGYEVVVKVKRETRTYHTNIGGSIVLLKK
jgi:hypothetical protein